MYPPMRKSYEVVGYAYNADLHCVHCSLAHFGAGEYLTLPVEAEDDEGNHPSPVFLDQCNQGDACPDHCGDCGERLDA